MQKTTELFKTALEVEIKSTLFYAKAAEATHDDNARMVFLELSNFEDGHINRIIEVAQRHNLGDQDELKRFIDQMEEDAGTTLSADESALLEKGDLNAIFKFAVNMETKSKQAYIDLAAHCDNQDFRAFCKEMIAEETKHTAQLEHERQSLQLSMDDRPPL
ncbi:MAG: ferritin family protein [Candidatus Polarisedimenticolaceae bacterium]|nr:ferritin family protein [Candidatus Polarisedimenticolaceae bacterium]